MKMNKINEQFENFWKLYQMQLAFTSNSKKRIYRVFLDGYGCALINIRNKSNKNRSRK